MSHSIDGKIEYRSNFAANKEEKHGLTPGDSHFLPLLCESVLPPYLMSASRYMISQKKTLGDKVYQ